MFSDNLNEADFPALAAVIVSPDCRFAGRMLGATRWVVVPALACWLASDNNPKVSRELARRTLVIKLDANAERPEQRSGFKIKNLLRWGIEHRVDLLHAALVLCRAWVAAKQPKGRAVLGSFESWGRRDRWNPGSLRLARISREQERTDGSGRSRPGVVGLGR